MQADQMFYEATLLKARVKQEIIDDNGRILPCQFRK